MQSPPNVSKLGLNPLPARFNQTIRLVKAGLPASPAGRKRGNISIMSELADGTLKSAWAPDLALGKAFAFAANMLVLYGVLIDIRRPS